MPQGKAAGARCVQLDQANRCRIFGRPDRPAVCSGLTASPQMCGSSAAQALDFLTRLEYLTLPDSAPAAAGSAGWRPAGRQAESRASS